MNSSRSKGATSEPAGDIWKALAHPCRRAILDRLHEGPATTTEVVEAVGETRFVVMQHLGVLRAADLVHTVADGRRRINHLNPVPLQRIYERWVSKYEGAWAAALTGLATTLEAEPSAHAPAARKKSRTKERTVG